MDHYLIMYKPIRENFLSTMTEREQEIIGRHFEYLQQLLKNDQLILAGPCEDGSLGIAIIKNCTQEQATDIMNNDPAVKNEIFAGQIRKFRLSLLANSQ